MNICRVSQKRAKAFSYFSGMDFPTRKHEEWKYDNLKFLDNDFDIIMSESGIKLSEGDFEKFLFDGLRDNMLVFVNGFLSEELSMKVSDNIVVESLSDGMKNHPDLFEKHFGTNTKDKDEIFTAMNTAMAPEGAFIHIPDNVRIKEKIQLIQISQEC